MKEPSDDLATEGASEIDRRLFLLTTGAVMAGALASEAAQAATPELTWMPAWQIRDGVVSGTYTALQVTEHFLARIARLDPVLHAFLTVDAEGARAQARAADAALARGEKPGPLHGVPIGIKDHIAVKGLPLPARGHAPSEGVKVSMPIAKEDSIVAERLRKAGAIIVGNTVMPGMGLGQEMTSLDRHPRNPWDPTKVPGSSSAGSAAAVASGMLPVAIGSDGGGSTRLPSSLCGVIGLHPTTGRVPNANYENARLMLTVTFGPIARNMRDVATVLQAISGPDGRDILSTMHPPAPDYAASLAGGARGMKLGWTEDFGYASKYFTPDSAAIVAQSHAAAHGFRSLGAEVVPAEIALEDFWPHVASTIYHYEGAPQPTATMEAAFKVRGRNRARMDALLETHDFILSTTIPFTAPTVEQWNTNWQGGVAFAPHYTSETFMFNWLQLPAISLPIGLYKGMPVGLQMVGKPDSEPRMFAAADAFMASFPQNARPRVS